jgi:hypothetical protein
MGLAPLMARVAVGVARTVTVALPVLSPAFAVQLASDKVPTVYVLFADGLTVTDIGLVLPLNDVPSDSVPVQGPTPVTSILNIATLPLQITCVPLIVALGRAFILNVIGLLVAVGELTQGKFVVITQVTAPPMVPASVYVALFVPTLLPSFFHW